MIISKCVAWSSSPCLVYCPDFDKHYDCAPVGGTNTLLHTAVSCIMSVMLLSKDGLLPSYVCLPWKCQINRLAGHSEIILTSCQEIS